MSISRNSVAEQPERSSQEAERSRPWRRFLKPGLHEALLTRRLEALLTQIPDGDASRRARRAARRRGVGSRVPAPRRHRSQERSSERRKESEATRQCASPPRSFGTSRRSRMEGAISRATSLSTPDACWLRCCGVFRTDDHSRSSARSRRCSTRRSSPTPLASQRSGTSFAPRSLGGRDRRRHGVRPLERRASAARCTPAALRGRQAAAGPDDDVHEQHGAASARRAGATRRPDQGLVRHRIDAAPRQGVDVPPRERLLDRLHRLVEPDPLGAGSRARVERPGLRQRATPTWSRRWRRSSRATGRAGTSSPTTPRVRRAHSSRSRLTTSRCSARSRSSCARSRRRCSSTSCSPATKATTGTCSSRRPAPGRQ